MSRCLLITMLALGFAFPAAADDAKREFNSSEERIVYAIGLSIAERLGEFELDENEIELVKNGLGDGLRENPQVSLRMWGHRVEGFRRARMEQTALREKALSAEFLAKIAAEKGVEKLPSKLLYKELVEGSGNLPSRTDRVKVHYHGTLVDGTVFDSSVQRGRPGTFGLDGVIACWTEGLQKMKVGGKSRLVCPPEIAYGTKGKPGKIRPGAVLTFEVELLEILPPRS